MASDYKFDDSVLDDLKKYMKECSVDKNTDLWADTPKMFDIIPADVDILLTLVEKDDIPKGSIVHLASYTVHFEECAFEAECTFWNQMDDEHKVEKYTTGELMPFVTAVIIADFARWQKEVDL